MTYERYCHDGDVLKRGVAFRLQKERKHITYVHSLLNLGNSWSRLALVTADFFWLVVERGGGGYDRFAPFKLPGRRDPKCHQREQSVPSTPCGPFHTEPRKYLDYDEQRGREPNAPGRVCSIRVGAS